MLKNCKSPSWDGGNYLTVGTVRVVPRVGLFWTWSVDHIRFWSARSKSNTLLKTDCDEIIDIVTGHRLESLQTTAGDSRVSSGESSTQNASCNSFGLDTTLVEVKDYLISIISNFTNEEDTNNNPWIYKDSNISHLFHKYQAATSEILVKHKALPVKSYIHELASLTHILFLCKDQHSEISEKILSLETLQELMTSLEQEVLNHKIDFPSNHFMAITNTLTDLSLGNKTREDVIMEFTILASQMNYGQKRLLYGLINL